MIDLYDIYLQKENISITPVEEYYIIFPSFTDEENTPYICKINKIAHFILSKINGKNSVNDLIKIVKNQYDQNELKIKEDVLCLLDNFEKKHIIIKKSR